MIRKTVPLEKEWKILQRQEARLIQKMQKQKPSLLNEKLAPLVPPKLQSAMETAFCKAFGLIFSHGNLLIEKTVNRKEREYRYHMNAYGLKLRESRKNMKAFAGNARASSRMNLLISGAEGVGLGLLGVGLPDIPLFTGVLLKSLYEIALSYGWDYNRPEERILILKLIQTSLSAGENFERLNQEINDWIAKSAPDWPETEESMIQKAGEALSQELLYMKFLQGIPLVGAAGGAGDSLCLAKVSAYARLKYQRRFLTDQLFTPPRKDCDEHC